MNIATYTDKKPKSLSESDKTSSGQNQLPFICRL